MTVLQTIIYACVVAALVLLAIGVGVSIFRMAREERRAKLRNLRNHVDGSDTVS